MALTSRDSWVTDPFMTPHSMAAPCVGCGSTTGAGRFDDWLGRFTCDDCRRAHAAQGEADRLTIVAAEVSEREAMWCLAPL